MLSIQELNEFIYIFIGVKLLMTMFLIILIGIGVFSCFFIVNQQEIYVIERFGRFNRVATAGLNWKIPLIEQIKGRMSLRLRQLEVAIETKTFDDVFVEILTSVQFRVLDNKFFEAFYTLDDPEKQIQAFVFDVVRARVPKIKLDDVFSKKDEIADSVKEELKDVMNNFGFDIIKALVTDINPDAKVKKAMNEINEAQRLRIAANERGEAEKILKIKHAEAESQSKILQGQGIAGQRKAIIEGLKESLHSFQETVESATTKDVMTLILMAQYFDTLKELGSSGKMNTILLPHSPSGLQDLYQQIRDSMIVAQEVGKGCEQSTQDFAKNWIPS